jgi:hypothetical protein
LGELIKEVAAIVGHAAGAGLKDSCVNMIILSLYFETDLGEEAAAIF